MIDSLANALTSTGLEPDSFIASDKGETIFRGQLHPGPGGKIWTNLALAARQTLYWPIIAGSDRGVHTQSDHDPQAILSAAPAGTIDQILRPRMMEFVADQMPEIADVISIDELAMLADKAGANAAGGVTRLPPQWPMKPRRPRRGVLQTLIDCDDEPIELLLIRMNHSWEVPAYLGFGGWNDCPPPELQVAALREWRREYQAVPACVTADVLECVVIKPPKTEPEAMRLAARQWIFCEDIVSQGTQSIRSLAMEIYRSGHWFFWWD